MAALTNLASGEQHTLSPVVIIGNNESASIKIDLGKDVIARIIFDGKNFLIEPLSENEKLFLNGKRLKKSILLEGDTIAFGDENFRFTNFPATYSLPENTRNGSTVLEALHTFSKSIVAGTTGNPLEALLDSLLSATKAEKGFLAIRTGNDFKIAAMKNLDAEKENECSFISESLIKKAIDKKEALLFSDAPEETSLGFSKSLIGLRLRSIMAVPILKESVVTAVMYAGSGKAASIFDESDLKTATIFAAQASFLLDIIEKSAALQEENIALKQVTGTGIIYESEIMETLVRQSAKLASSSLSILITGETGTGKELFARMIHSKSNRKNGPFIVVNCAAIPENIAESELFGHKKGAFTGAISDTEGKVGAASGGTLFLDEIGELPLPQQAKLLRILENGEYEPVGDTVTRKADVRIIAATNRDLTKTGFREDLFFRLSAAVIKLPSLKERSLDILLIAKTILSSMPENRERKLKFSRESEAAMLNHSWPGNVRELRHRISRAAILAEGLTIMPKDLELDRGEENPVLPLLEAKERFALDYIRRILALYEGNKSAAARALGIDPRTVYRYIDGKEDSSQ